MRSFLILVACLAALASGVGLAYVITQNPFASANVVNTGAASTEPLAASANNLVQSVAASVTGAQGSSSTATPSYPAHPNWTWQTTDGKTYENVVITNLDSTEVTISHSGGVAHVPLNTLPADVLSEINSATAATSQSATSPAVASMDSILRDQLVDLHGQPVAAPGPDIKYYAIYYAASWCPPCQTFTPALVSWYRGFKPAHPDFELIFVSEDKSEADMSAYMQEMQMPWPAVKYSVLKRTDGTFRGPGIEQFANNGIPDLVLVDSSGTVLADSFNGSNYTGPQGVLDYLNSKLGGK